MSYVLLFAMLFGPIAKDVPPPPLILDDPLKGLLVLSYLAFTRIQ